MPVDIRGLTPLIEVFDMPTAVRFYRDLLGFEVISTSNPGPEYDWALLRRGSVELMFNTAYERDTRPAQPDPVRVKAHKDTTLYFGCKEIDAAYEELRANGVQLKPPSIAPYGMKQLYFLDPDGYNLCLTWPATQEMQDAWHEWYGSEPA